jgi:hypothetical protein
MKSCEVLLNEALDEVAFYKRISAELRAEIHRLRLRDAQTELEERIAALPTESQERLRKAFPGTFIGGLKQAVKTEQRHMSKQDARVERILG